MQEVYNFNLTGVFKMNENNWIKDEWPPVDVIPPILGCDNEFNGV